jgi:hypothetical protein
MCLIHIFDGERSKSAAGANCYKTSADSTDFDAPRGRPSAAFCCSVPGFSKANSSE